MSITDVEDWLYSAFSREHNGVYDDVKLGPVKTVLQDLQCQVRPVTVAGTKGKGSTVRFIEAGLIAAGAKTLAFTSPHVLRINERWRGNGIPLENQRLMQAAQDIAAAEIRTQQQLTYFERCFMIAAHIAQADNYDYFLCEVGLGGRLDCANALDTQLAIVTALSFDHCHILGHTLKEIAYEKCAIARPDAPLIIGPQSEAAAQAISEQNLNAASIYYSTPRNDLKLAMPGRHQQGNASTALDALRLLLPETDESVFINAISQVQLSARCQIIKQEQRLILVDAGHNGASVHACMQVAQDELHGDWPIIVGCMQDKMIDDIIGELPKDHRILRCGFDWPRARNEDDWPAAARAWPFYENIQQALAEIPADQDCCICGSFYLAGEALAALEADPAIPG